MRAKYTPAPWLVINRGKDLEITPERKLFFADSDYNEMKDRTMRTVRRLVARFRNGEVRTRTTPRAFTHVWMVVYPSRHDTTKIWTEAGFASSEELAHKAMKRFMDCKPTFYQVVEVVQVNP